MSENPLKTITDLALANGGKKYVLPLASAALSLALLGESHVLVPESFRLPVQIPIYLVFLWNLAKWVRLPEFVEKKLRRHAKLK